MTKDCANCEKDAMLEVAELTLKLEEAENYIGLLKQCLNAKEAMCNFLQDKNETLENKIRIYMQHIENQKGYTEK